MAPQLPPPDPYESLGMAPADEVEMPAPIAVYARGRPSSETEAISDAILSLRPGALIVLASD